MDESNTDTPETDGEWNRLACQDHPEFERNLADFARKLERERDEAREELAAVTEALQSPIEVELDMIRGKIAVPDRSEFEYIEQIKTVTEQRDRLAEALNAILNDDPDSPLYKIKEARAALAAWKEAHSES